MRLHTIIATALALILAAAVPASAWFGGGKFKTIKPVNGEIILPLEDISDGSAHYFQTRSDNGDIVKFFVLKSRDGIIRAAVDACDVCYRSGKGYVQDGYVMVCTNCRMRFASDRINEVKGGCNPAPLERTVDNGSLKIAMAQINANAWLCAFKK